MPDFRKSYKKSKNSKNSKSGGRRRKHTMRKYRRGKKVMRGGATYNDYSQLATLFEGKDNLKNEIFTLYDARTFQELYNNIVKETPTGNVNTGFIVNYSDKGKRMSAELKALINPV